MKLTRRTLLSTAIGLPLAGVASAEEPFRWDHIIEPVRAPIKAVLDGRAPFVGHQMWSSRLENGEYLFAWSRSNPSELTEEELLHAVLEGEERAWSPDPLPSTTIWREVHGAEVWKDIVP